MRLFALASLLGVALMAPLAAQSCSDLTVTGDGTPGTSLTLAVAGTLPNAATAVVIGETAGSTPINLGRLGSFTLGIAAPFFGVPLGFSDGSGAASVSFQVPSDIPAHVDLFGQAISIGFSAGPPPGLATCTSDVEAFGIG